MDVVVFLLFLLFPKISFAFDESIIEPDKIQDDDAWSEWSEWSTCSRTCGGGVAVQSRRCLNIQGCRGSSVRYHVCNLQKCPPGSTDFRALQCAEYNSVYYSGELHEWEPVQEKWRPTCSLTCRAKGNSDPLVKINARVIDGTRCGNNSKGICVHGQCQYVGCDLVLGSEKKLDSCGVCGGDGSMCQEKQKRRGKWIKSGLGPCSATCGGGYRTLEVSCVEVDTGEELDTDSCSGSEKPFPEISSCGNEACPASWNVGPWEECSTTCGVGYKLREVSCVEIRNESKIRVADHDCLEPRPPHRQSCGGADCPRWYGGIWSECSVTCGEGIQRRAVQCRDKSGKSSASCSLTYRPESTRPCRTGIACPPLVLAHPRHHSDNTWSEETAGEESYDDAPFVPSTEPYDKGELVPAEPTFIASSWGKCSTTCGEGIQTRTVTCKIFLEFSRTVAVLPDSQCPGARPVEAKRCYLKPCTAVMLSESSVDEQETSKRLTSLESLEPETSYIQKSEPSSSIQLPMGTASKLQSAKIMSKESFESLPFSSPNSEEAPPRIVSLDSMKKESSSSSSSSRLRGDGKYELLWPQNHKYIWKHSGYTPCSASCLGGTQESVSYCIRKEDGKRVSPQLCDLKSRPDTITKTCNDRPCPPYWETSEFEPCSKTCGGGITRRQIKCVHQVTASTTRKLILPDSLCPQPPPYTQKFCNMMPCPPIWVKGKWSQCSTSCGRGIKTRSVDCVTIVSVTKQKKELPNKCSKNRPPSFKSCKKFTCRGPKRQRKRKGPTIKALTMQDYKQKKFMKTVILKVGGFASVFHGSDVKIKCPVRRFDRRNISWLKNRQPLLGGSENNLKRMRVTRKGVLKIHRIQYTDAALYTCRAAEEEANLMLKVQPLPSSFASSEESPSHHNSKTNLKNDINEVYNSKNSRFSSKAVDLDGFAKAGFQLVSADDDAEEETEENAKRIGEVGDDVLDESKKTSTTNLNEANLESTNSAEGPPPPPPPSSSYKFPSKNIHTMEENSLEQQTSAPGPEPDTFIYGRIAHHGVPARYSPPTSGISFLSDKVAQSKNEKDVITTGHLFFEHQPASENKNKSSNESLANDGANQHVYGKLLNTSTDGNHRVVNEENTYFGTLLHSLNPEDPKSKKRLKPTMSSIFHFPNILRDHKERSTEVELKEEALSTLFEKEEPLMRFSSDPNIGGPKFLGKGTRESLEFEWKVTNWTDCSQTCSFSGSSGGYQVRSTQCIVRANNISQGVDGALCEDAGLVAPPTIQRCGFEECPRWKVDAWSDCENSRCFTLHYAYQKRNVTCLLHNGQTVSPDNCDEVTKPRHKRECYNRECVGVWRTGDWSICTAPCGGQGYRTRLLQCVWNGTKKSAGNACREQPRPEVVKWCDGDPCEEEDEEKPVKESQCKDLSRYCRIVQRINMCRIQHYRRKCCRSCQ